MDNKKWYSRFATIFWWSLTILPFLYIIFVFVGCIVNYNTLGGTPVTAEIISTCFNDAFSISTETIINTFNDFSISALTTGYVHLFDNLGVVNNEFWGVVVAYMTTIACVHLVFDVVVWLPHMAHNLLEKWC